MTLPVTRIKKGDLSEYLKSTRKVSRVSAEVEKYLAARPADLSRRQDVLHPSEVTKSDACIREAWWRIKRAREGILPPEDRPGLRLQTIFDVGHAAHARWQRYLGLTGVMYGYWKCPGCGNVVGPRTYPGDGSCDQCERPGEQVYEEIAMDWGLFSGHTDGWMIWPDKDQLLEVKTIGPGTIRSLDLPLFLDNDGDAEKAFNAIRRPLKDHRRQATVYLRLLHLMWEEGRLERKPPEEINFLYELKSNGAVKELIMGYQPELVDDVFWFEEDLEGFLKDDEEPACDHPSKAYGGSACKKCHKYDETELE